MVESSLVKEEDNVDLQAQNRLFQVDILKTLMIFLVIFDHIVAWNLKRLIGVAFWERISIPIFLIILGFNAGLSFERSGAETLRELYSKQYFKKKVLRYVVPFALYYGVSTVIGLMVYNWNFVAMMEHQYYPEHGIINLFTGFVPFWGPGNWFIPLLLQSILVLPLLYWLFKKNPKLALIACVLIEVAMHLLVFFLLGEITSWEEGHILTVFMTSVLFYTTGIAFGLWFSMGYELEEKRNWFLLILFPISFMYLIYYQFFGYRILIDGVPLIRGDYNFIVIPYSATLFLLALDYKSKLLPGSKLYKLITTISKSTYHILLIQMLGYGMIYAYGTHYLIDLNIATNPIDLLNLIVMWAICIPYGIWWQKISNYKAIEKKIIYHIILFASFMALFYILLFIGRIL